MSKKKKTTEEFKNEVYNLVGDEYEVVGEYINNRTKIEFIHKKCEQKFFSTPHNFLSVGSRCPYCAGNMAITKEDFVQKLFEKFGDEYILVGDFYNIRKKAKIFHKKCNNIIEVLPQTLLKGQGCPYCSKRKKKTTEEFKKDVYNLVGDEYEVVGEYINAKTKIAIKHLKCNYTHLFNPNGFLSSNNRCPKCSGSLSISSKDFNKRIYDLVGDEYQVKDEYKNAFVKLKTFHKKCGKFYMMRPNDFMNGHRCPHCSTVQGWSNSEKEVLDFIKTILQNEQIIENDRTILDGKEIDIYIPSKKIGIEYNGLIWHSNKFNEDLSASNAHINKTKLANKKDIRLIQIFEDEWLYKKDIVKDKIKSILGVNTSNIIYARKTEIKEISSKERNVFLEKNHIQGKDGANISLGMFYNDELVGVMSFCKPRLNMGQKTKEEGRYELSRYATLLNHSIVGGFSKMLKYAIRHYDIKSLYTYADLRWTDKNNNMYCRNGFRLTSISKPNYFYISKNYKNRENRFKYRKSELKKFFPKTYDDSLSEREITKLAGLYRIYDCGNAKYEYDNKE